MNYLLYAALIALLGYVIYHNVTVIMSYRHNKEYIECYQAMLSNEEGVYERINRYIDEQKEPEFINKGRILKLYCALRDDLDYSKTLEDLDLKQIFCPNGRLSKKKIDINSDIFIWIFMCLGLARNLSRFDVLEALNEKLNDLNMDDRLEIKEAKAIYKALSESDTSGVDFLNDILQGNYVDYEYDKNLISLYKRIAACTLAYSGEPIEDYYKEDLRSFASTLIGQGYMKSLEIYEKYPPVVVMDKPKEEE